MNLANRGKLFAALYGKFTASEDPSPDRGAVVASFSTGPVATGLR